MEKSAKQILAKGFFSKSAQVAPIIRSGADGNYTYSTKSGMERKPVNFVSFYDACRFANWLSNQLNPEGTEFGVYDLTNPISELDNSIQRSLSVWRNGGVAIVSEEEWYKAAYYDPTINFGEGGYWYYPTRSNDPPEDQLPNSSNPNSANHTPPGSPTQVGGYALAASYYGTFDQAGNLFEWVDDFTDTTTRYLRGGSYAAQVEYLDALFRGINYPTQEIDSIGFRISSLEPLFNPKIRTVIQK